MAGVERLLSGLSLKASGERVKEKGFFCLLVLGECLLEKAERSEAKGLGLGSEKSFLLQSNSLLMNFTTHIINGSFPF